MLQRTSVKLVLKVRAQHSMSYSVNNLSFLHTETESESERQRDRGSLLYLPPLQEPHRTPRLRGYHWTPHLSFQVLIPKPNTCCYIILLSHVSGPSNGYFLWETCWWVVDMSDTALLSMSMLSSLWTTVPWNRVPSLLYWCICTHLHLHLWISLTHKKNVNQISSK